jgi:hypothetical protein
MLGEGGGARMEPVVLVGLAAGARVGNADTTETVVLVVPIIEGMARPAAQQEVIVTLAAAAKNSKNLAVVRKL